MRARRDSRTLKETREGRRDRKDMKDEKGRGLRETEKHKIRFYIVGDRE